MANEEQLEILKQGVKVWNKWVKNERSKRYFTPNLERAYLKEVNLERAYLKEVNLEEANLERANLERADLQKVRLERADLQGARLQNADLRGAKFWYTNLDRANLKGANLKGAKLWYTYLRNACLQEANLQNANLQEANLQNANLQEADLRGANLQGANLQGANLQGANLQGANLQEANLQGTDLQKAGLQHTNLQGADLRGADLQGADLRNATWQTAKWLFVNLRGANLQEANLQGAKLQDTDLREANLQGADLRGANLRSADLREADLREADLKVTTLIQTNLANANLTGVMLYGTGRDNWIIDSVKCDYVCWDREGKERTPTGRDLEPREFEELYKHLPTFDYYFEYGFTALDAVVMSRIVEAINEKHPEFELKLDSFHSRGQPHAKFTVLHKEVVEEALKQVTVEYEAKIKALEAERNLLDKFLTMAIKEPRTVIKQLALTEKGGLTMGDTHIGRDNIEISGNAQVTNLTTGASFQGDHAQQLLQSTTPQSSKEDILKLLSFVQQELPKLPLPDDVKEEVANEVKGAEIQAKKEEPDKKKIGEKLQSAIEALEKVPKLTKAAITVGNLLGQAILWCGMKWVEWRYGG